MHIQTVCGGSCATCCYLLWEDDGEGCVLIDSGAEPWRIREAAQGKPIKAILLTHGHFDHIEYAKELMEADTQLVIHRLDAPMLTDPDFNASALLGLRITAPEATMLVSEGSRLNFAGIELTVLHTPGHTPGCVCYLCGDSLFTGDTMFHYGHGRTDLPGACVADLYASLQRLYPLAQQYRIYPGHEG